MGDAAQLFIESGLLGAAVVVLAGVIVYMQRKNESMQKEIVATQEKWRASETERAERLMDALNTASAVQSALVNKIQTGREER